MVPGSNAAAGPWRTGARNALRIDAGAAELRVGATLLGRTSDGALVASRRIAYSDGFGVDAPTCVRRAGLLAAGAIGTVPSHAARDILAHGAGVVADEGGCGIQATGGARLADQRAARHVAVAIYGTTLSVAARRAVLAGTVATADDGGVPRAALLAWVAHQRVNRNTTDAVAAETAGAVGVARAVTVHAVAGGRIARLSIQTGIVAAAEEDAGVGYARAVEWAVSQFDALHAVAQRWAADAKAPSTLGVVFARLAAVALAADLATPTVQVVGAAVELGTGVNPGVPRWRVGRHVPGAVRCIRRIRVIPTAAATAVERGTQQHQQGGANQLTVTHGQLPVTFGGRRFGHKPRWDSTPHERMPRLGATGLDF